MFHTELNDPQHIKIGKKGEDIACAFLKQKGYQILERNFKRKWGEIDIVCRERKNIGDVLSSIWNTNNNVSNGTKLVFVEVKTLNQKDFLNPEDNLTQDKQRKLIRTCQLYLSEKKLDPDLDWRIDAVLISLDIPAKKAKIRHVKGAIY